MFCALIHLLLHVQYGIGLDRVGLDTNGLKKDLFWDTYFNFGHFSHQMAFFE